MDLCPHCGGSLSETQSISKDELDYEVKVIKKRHFFHEYCCDSCGKTFRTKHPLLKAENQYGSGIQTMALSLMNLGFVSINRIRKLLNCLAVGNILSISDGYLIKLQKRFSYFLHDFVEEVRTACIASPLIYWDDTVIFINTSRSCFRFYGNENLALYTAHSKKDLAGILEDNLLQKLPESATVMHDHNTINYNQNFHFRNVECLQHLERDLQKISDVSHHEWAAQMKLLFQSMIHQRKTLISNGIDHFNSEDISAFLSRYDWLLKSGYKEYFHDLNRYFSKDENALILRLEDYRMNYTEWIHDFSVPTTNNLSERSLRFIKCKDKISGQFQSLDYAQFFANIRTYIETCARNGIHEFQALLRLTQGNPFSLNELQNISGV